MDRDRKILFILSLIVGVSLLYGFLNVGNSIELGNRNLDQTRVNNISTLKYAIDNYYATNRKLPPSLDAVSNSSYNIGVSKDPETGSEYGYFLVTDTSYKLCATFATSSSDDAVNQSATSEFRHPKGYHCFTLSISSYYLPSPTPYYYLTPTPTLNPQNYSVLQSCELDLDPSTANELKIMGIYELEDSVLFTTNKIANATVNYWTDPKVKGSAMYMYGLSVFDAKLNKVTGYKIRVFDASGNEGTSQEYIFQGNRTVKKDPRCGIYSKLIPTPASLYTNLALHKTVSFSSSVEVNGWSAVNATDGNYSSGWSSDNTLSANHSEWITVDLGSSLLINKVTLFPRADVGKIGFYFPIDFTIQVSTDNIKFTKVISKISYPNPLASPQAFTFSAVNARYVRIEGTNLSNVEWEAYRMQFAEIEVSNTRSAPTFRSNLL